MTLADRAPAPPLNERGVDEIAEQLAVIIALPRRLDHHHRDQLFLGRDPKYRAGEAAPEEFARRAGRRRHPDFAPNRESEPEAVSRRQQEGLTMRTFGPR